MNQPSAIPPLSRRLLTVDLRSLAACRIAIGLLLLVDLAMRTGELTAFLTDEGMFPREIWSQRRGDHWVWSLHAMGGGSVWIGILFVIQAMAAGLLMLGAWTRLATVICWALAASLHARNPVIINAGDAFLRMMLFWGMFLPWGRCWSWDARHQQAPVPGSPSKVAGPSIATLAILLQVCLVYWVTGWLKLNNDWLHGRAMARVVELDFCIKPWGRLLAEHPMALTAASYATPWCEMLLPLLVWSPWKTAALRTWIVFGALAFHLMIDLVLHVGLFGLVSQAAWLVFLPTAFWNRLLGVDTGHQFEASKVSPPRGKGIRMACKGLCFAGLIVVLVTNLSSMVHPERPQLLASANVETDRDPTETQRLAATGYSWWAPKWMTQVGNVFMLHQHWTMFDRPPLTDNWVVARANLADGTQIDVLRGGAVWDERGSPQTARRLPNQHWRYFFRRMAHPDYDDLRSAAAKFLLTDWNRNHPDQQASRLVLVLFEEQFGEAGYRTRNLASVGEPNEFDLDDALRQLDSVLQLP